MVKKSISLIFLLACIFSLFTVQAFADGAVKYGDLNGDTKINSTDYSLLKRYVTNAADFTPLQIAASDLNGDGKVNSTDVSLLKRKILGMIDTFPAYKLSTSSCVGIESYDTVNKTITLDTPVDGRLVYKYTDDVNPAANSRYGKFSIDYKDGVIYLLRGLNYEMEGYIKAIVLGSNTKKPTLDTLSTTSISFPNDSGDYIVLHTFHQADFSYQIDLDNIRLKLNGSVLDTSDISKLIGTYAKIYGLGNVYMIEAFDLNTVRNGIINEVNPSYVKYQEYDNNDKYFNFTAGTELNVSIDGMQTTLANLKPDMFFEAWESSDCKEAFISASSVKVSGTLMDLNSNTVVIGNTTYNTNPLDKIDYISYDNGVNYNKNSLEGLVNTEVVGYIGQDGNIHFIKGISHPVTTSFIGLVKSVKIENKNVVLERDVNGVSTEIQYPVKSDSDDLSDIGKTQRSVSSGSAITWGDFVADQGYMAGDKTGYDFLSAEKRIYKFTTNSLNQIIRIQRLSFGDVGSAPEGLAGDGMTYTVTNFNKDSDSIEIANNLISSLNKNLLVDGTVFFDLKDGKAVYWKDIEGQSGLASKIAWSLKANGYLDAVAFLDDTYKNVTDQNYECYKYVTGESYDGQCYNLVPYGESPVKLYKENVTNEEFKQLDNDFIGYVKDGEGIKIKLAVAPSYTTSAGIGIRVIKNEDENFKSVCGKFIKKDGTSIVVDGESYVLSSDAKAARIWFKSSGQVDTRTIVNIEDISQDNSVALILIDNKVRAIYSLR